MVTLVGTSRSAISDARGHFRIDSVAPGTYTLTMLHGALDSLGLSGASTKLVVNGAIDAARVSVPSFATLWRAACGTTHVPADSGFIFGSVRDARVDMPVAAATVALSFSDYGVDNAAGLVERHWSGTATTGDDGSYVLCGLPLETSLRMVASKDSLASSVIDVRAGSLRVQRRDLLISAIEDSMAPRGIVRGIVRRKENGQPVEGVRILTPGTTEVRSGTDGQFTLRGVPLGTRQIDALSVGSAPMSGTVDVRVGDTASITFDLEKITVLEKMKVRATSARAQRIAEMEERRERKMGRFIDSTEVAHFPTIGTALASMKPLGGGFCRIYMDGILQVNDSKPLAFRSPRDIAQIEVHGNSTVPIEYHPGKNCLVLLVWTKNGLP
jgi:hypothetical protein